MDRCTEKGLTLHPMAMDTFWGWHPEVLALITRLTRALVLTVRCKDREQVHCLRQRLGITLVRDTAAMLAARTHTFAAL